ncbi:hypothetical protein AAY473_029287 [Plecturocebus cupreus]
MGGRAVRLRDPPRGKVRPGPFHEDSGSLCQQPQAYLPPPWLFAFGEAPAGWGWGRPGSHSLGAGRAVSCDLHRLPVARGTAGSRWGEAGEDAQPPRLVPSECEAEQARGRSSPRPAATTWPSGQNPDARGQGRPLPLPRPQGHLRNVDLKQALRADHGQLFKERRARGIRGRARTGWAAFRSQPELPVPRPSLPCVHASCGRWEQTAADPEQSLERRSTPTQERETVATAGVGPRHRRGGGELGKRSFAPLLPRVHRARLKPLRSLLSYPTTNKVRSPRFALSPRRVACSLPRFLDAPGPALRPAGGAGVIVAQARGRSGASLRPPDSS